MLVRIGSTNYRRATSAIGRHSKSVGEAFGADIGIDAARADAAADDFGVGGRDQGARSGDDEVHEVDAQLPTTRGQFHESKVKSNSTMRNFTPNFN